VEIVGGANTMDLVTVFSRVTGVADPEKLCLVGVHQLLSEVLHCVLQS
jgi:hypothetical protein